MGWIENRRPGNAGGIGNTLEDLLDVAENNRRVPDFGEWEIKSQRSNTSSLLTLFHTEPMPREERFVPRMLLPRYGWPHQEAGTKYGADERSFRQTINATSASDRGFSVVVDRRAQRIYIRFDFSEIGHRHADWQRFIQSGAGTDDLSPNPYWTFAELEYTLHTKLSNLMYVQADTLRQRGNEYFRYNHFEAYMDPSLESFLNLMDEGYIYVDFDARTGHNHGTKFRIRADQKVRIYGSSIEV